MSQYDSDIIVIGAGPAGSFFAEQASKLGFRVLLLDKERFPRDKLCAGWIPEYVLDTLNLKIEDYPYSLQVLDDVNFWIGPTKYPSRPEKTKHYAIMRKEFDAYLLERAQKSGARFKQGLVKHIEFKEDSVLVHTDNAILRSKIVIGAAGTFCPVYKMFNNAKENHVICLESLEKIDERQNISTNIFPDKDLKGYSWCFMKSGYLNVGLGRTNELDIFTRKNDLIKRLIYLGIIPKKSKLNFKGYFYRVNDNPGRIISGNRFLLIGDSAGLAHRLTGEGIGPALLSAKLAAEYIAINKDNPDLTGFSDIVRKTFKIPGIPMFPGLYYALFKISFIRRLLMKFL